MAIDLVFGNSKLYLQAVQDLINASHLRISWPLPFEVSQEHNTDILFILHRHVRSSVFQGPSFPDPSSTIDYKVVTDVTEATIPVTDHDVFDV